MEKSYYVQLNELFRDWLQKNADSVNNEGFCKDGIMLKAYKTEKTIDMLWDESSRRVMFVIKDMNTPNGEEQLEGHHNMDIIAGYCGYDLENNHALADAEACAWIAREIL